MKNFNKACMKYIDACCIAVIICTMFGIERIIRPFVSTRVAKKMVDWNVRAAKEIVASAEKKYN